MPTLTTFSQDIKERQQVTNAIANAGMRDR
jgi:hypothetical protein